MKHEIGTVNAGAGTKGICTCGWMGPPRNSHEEAISDARQHKTGGLLSSVEGQRLLLLRERARTRQGEPSWSDVDFALLVFDRLRSGSKP